MRSNVHYQYQLCVSLCMNADLILKETCTEAVDPYRSWSPLTEEGYAEKLRLLREASTIPMERWRAPTVLAWLEIALGMPQYGPRCSENVKSGKVSVREKFVAQRRTCRK